MNRLVLIGNGFDLAHGLKTSYMDFINWYWEQRLESLSKEHTPISQDCLGTFEVTNTKKHSCWSSFISYYSLWDIRNRKWKHLPVDIINFFKEQTDDCSIRFSHFFDTILQSIETKGWVDIENDYYKCLKSCALNERGETTIEDLNKQFLFLQENLVKYLKEENTKDIGIKSEIQKKIYSPFNDKDIAISGKDAIQEHIEYGMKLDDRGWGCKLWNYGYDAVYSMSYINDYKQDQKNKEIPYEFLLPNQIMILNFNYTNIAQKYLKEKDCFSINHIHGNLNDTNSIIFGYGDEKDRNYEAIIEKNDNKLLKNIKSIRYLESDNYRKMLAFIESAPFQVCIMGHSCGYSDRTLLNTLFEHKNCVSVKAYYYKKENGTDNYLDIVQNISRNFTDMKLMRDRVVNKVYCEPLINS